MINTSIDIRATGKNIKTKMDQKGITAGDVRKALGLAADQCVYKWCSGVGIPSTENFVKLSEFLGISLDELIVVDDRLNNCLGGQNG